MKQNNRIKQDHSYTIKNCTIVTENGSTRGKTVVVRQGIIDSITDEAGPSAKDLQTYDGKGLWLVPGFVELHLHGCGNLGVEDVLKGETAVLRKMCMFLREQGINTFLPTLPFNLEVISCLADEMERDPALGGMIPGMYVEGPFVSKEMRGGIDENFIHPPDPDLLKRILDAARGRIRMMTIAPELPGIGAIIEMLLDSGIIPCLGHSRAVPSDKPDFPEGTVLNITHLFNAMSPVSHKRPGLAMLPFLDDEIYFELNGDGIHINRDMLRTCRRHLNRERMVLISDAVVSAGLGHGTYSYFGSPVVSDERGVRYGESGVLIGSNMLIPQAARNFAEASGAALPDVIRMITANPCRLLGLEDRGSIVPGKKADLLLINNHFQTVKNFSNIPL